jgi:hypothetical protein
MLWGAAADGQQGGGHSASGVIALAGPAEDDATDAEPATENWRRAATTGTGPAGLSRQSQAVSAVKERLHGRLVESANYFCP